MSKTISRSKMVKRLALFVLVIVVIFTLDARCVSQFAEKFDVIQLGMNESKVVVLLGSPSYEGSSFYLGQEQGFEDAYKRALLSDSVKYLSWNRGMDCVFTVGIDGQEKVTLADRGCT